MLHCFPKKICFQKQWQGTCRIICSYWKWKESTWDYGKDFQKGSGEVNNVWFSSFMALRNKKWASVSLKPLKPYEDKTLDISKAEMTATNDKLPLGGFSTSQWIHRQRFPWAAWRLVWWVTPREVEYPGSDSLDCQQHNHRTTRAWRSRQVSNKGNRPTVLSGQLCS